MTIASALGHGVGSSPMSHATPIVFVVDDDISVRESLELRIRAESWHAEVFASAREFLGHHRTPVPSCLVLDVSLPGLNGLELQEKIAEAQLHLPIIFITGHGDVPTSVRAMKAGAIEFLTKPFTDEALLSAIKQALERSRVTLEKQAQLKAVEERYQSLTHREQQVMGLVVSGLLNKQVGGELGISEITVKAHRGKVMQKMKANSLPDLVKMAEKLRITPVYRS